MSNGQVWLDAEQDESPLDPSRSITRVGAGADTRKCRADARLFDRRGEPQVRLQQAMDLTPGSWRLLNETINELLRVNPRCLVVSSMERRVADGIDGFLTR
ncbi:hypothetical protein ACHAW5_010165 [Stephanodiscus triporus]|uniref:Uncharacterized protein n=1 Tax=Stephanodiscus triporus TaxID=2934178 RepID=A0ABD3QYV7_9STRA